MAQVLNKLLRWIGIEEDEDFEDDFYDQDLRDTQSPSSSAFSGQRTEPRDRNDAYDRDRRRYYEPEVMSQSAQARKKGGKVVPHPSYNEQAGAAALQAQKHQTSIYQINEHGETRLVIDDILTGKSVLLNLETLGVAESQRVIDTLSGAAYAIDANIKKVAHQTYLIAPNSVEINGAYATDEPQTRRPAAFARSR